MNRDLIVLPHLNLITISYQPAYASIKDKFVKVNTSSDVTRTISNLRVNKIRVGMILSFENYWNERVRVYYKSPTLLRKHNYDEIP